MGKLSDILRNGDIESLGRQWDEAEAAADFAPLPAGEYDARIVAGELEQSRSNRTPGYKLTFAVLDGEHAGRRFWHDIWLTEAALPMAKRDLGKLGVTSLEQLEKPLPAGIRCRVKLALRRNDDDTEYNRIKWFQVIGIDEPDRDAFAPDAATNDDAIEANGAADAGLPDAKSADNESAA